MAEVRIEWDPAAIEAWARGGGQPAQALDRAATAVLQEMKRLCPVSKVQPVYATKGATVPGGKRLAGDFPLRPSGYLRRSCRKGLEVDGSIIIGPSADYGIYVEQGTPPHAIDSHGPWPLRNRATGQCFGRHVNHPGTKAQPFIVRSLDVLGGQVIRL